MSGWLASRRTEQPLQTVIVSTKTGRSIRGALLERTRDALILRAASVATQDAQGRVEWHPLDGDSVVPMDNVDFYQDALDATLLDNLG